MGRELVYAGGIAAVWIVLACGCAAGLYLARRLWIMMACHCDWKDAGARMRARAQRKYGAHRGSPKSAKPAVAVTPSNVVVRAEPPGPHRTGKGDTITMTALAQRADRPSQSGAGQLEAPTETLHRADG
jgi:hypothetical protein